MDILMERITDLIADGLEDHEILTSLIADGNTAVDLVSVIRILISK